jgi:hypothetical protein
MAGNIKLKPAIAPISKMVITIPKTKVSGTNIIIITSPIPKGMVTNTPKININSAQAIIKHTGVRGDEK